MKDELVRRLEEIDYFFKRLSLDYVAGQHPSAIRGSGFHIKGYDNIFNRPDFPSVDWIATVVSGSRLPLVKILEQKSAITVFVLADVSASVGFAGIAEKKKEMAKFVAALGFSAYKIGDRFGLIAYGDKLLVYFEPQVSRSYSLEIAEWLWDLEPSAALSDGFPAAMDYLPRKPHLIFWLSDFNVEYPPLEKFLTEHAGSHDFVPVVFWDSAEFEKMPDWGMVWLNDPETKERRPELLTPGRRKQLQTAFLERQQSLKSLFKKFDVEPIFIVNELNPLQIADFFLQRRL